MGLLQVLQGDLMRSEKMPEKKKKKKENKIIIVQP